MSSLDASRGFKPLQPLGGNRLRSKSRVRRRSCSVAMPVAAARSKHAELDGEFGQASSGFGIVAGMPGFDRVQSLLLETGENRAGTAVFEMSGGHEAADQMDQRCYLGEGGEPLGHVAGAGPPDVAVEGVVQVGRMTPPDQRTRHMWPSNRPVPRLEKDVVYLECEADSLELRHDVAASLQSITLPLVEKTLEPGIVKRKEIAQDMHLAPGRCDRELTPTDHAHLVLRSGGNSRRHSVECVVIGQRDRRQAGGLGPRNDFFRSELAV